MNELVQHLAQGEHPITVGGPKPSREDFHKRIEDIGYIFIKFTATQGGTDLGVQVEKTATDLTRANFADGIGIAHVEGTLTLNYVKVRCIAEVELSTLNGTGHLVILEEVQPYAMAKNDGAI